MIGFMIGLLGKGYWEGDPLFIVMLLAGALLPDIDAENSIVGRKIKPLSRLLEHRGITHSLSGMVVFVAIMQVLLYVTGIETSILAFMLGYLSHLVADSMTPSGVEVFYPFKFKIRGPIVTNSILEKMIFTTLLVIAVKIVYF